MRAASIKIRIKGTEQYVPVGAPQSLAAAMTEPAAGGASSPFHGASTGRRLGSWRPTSSGPNTIVAATAPEMVRRSHDLGRNNLHGRRAQSLYRTHIVGTGIVPRSLCPNKAAREAVQKLWEEWVDYADADGAFDFYGLQARAVDGMVDGGESFGRLRSRRASDGLPVPLQVQLLPTEQVPLDYSTPNGTNPVLQGIERNGIGQRVAYWMYRAHPGDAAFWQSADAQRLSRIPAADVCHLRLAPPGQLRGLPWLAVALSTLHQLGQWKDAALLRKQLIAALVGFVRRTATGDMTPEDVAKAWGEVQQALGMGDLAATMEPGTIQYLEPNEEITFTQWQETAGQDEVFERASLRSIASGLDLIYEELSGDWTNTNDRVYRAAFNTFKRTMRQHQHHLLGFQFNRPIWNRWIDVAVASGALRVPKSLTDAELKRVEWRPERWEYLNPKQDIEAEIAEVEAGFVAREAKIADRGDVAETVDAQRASDREREKRMGLTQTRPSFSPDDPEPPATNQDRKP